MKCIREEMIILFGKTQKLRVSGISFIECAQYRNIGKPDNIKVSRSNKHDSHNRLRLPMHDRG